MPVHDSPYDLGTFGMAAVLRTAATTVTSCLVVLLLALPSAGLKAAAAEQTEKPTKIGVIYVVHGAPNGLSLQGVWDAAIQMGSYNPNSFLFQNAIWNDKAWPGLIGLEDPQRAPSALSFYRKLAFQISRVGGIDAANPTTKAQVRSLTKALTTRAASAGLKFHVDWATWIAVDEDMKHLPFPRFVYDRNGAEKVPVTYCGGAADAGLYPGAAWPDCDRQRYNVAGPIDRLLAKGVERIVVIDTLVGGVRFSKTFDVLRLLRKAMVAAETAGATQVPLTWANDPTGLMADSYPNRPQNWTRSLGLPQTDRKVSLAGRGNGVTDDQAYADLLADGILAAMPQTVSAEDSGVLLFNHGIHLHNETFDPKINDTIVLNKNIQTALLRKWPGLKPDNVVGGWMGVVERGAQVAERTRAMRGGNLGHAYLYETAKQMPKDKWGLRFWEALDRLRQNSAKHIVVAFPQIIVSSIPSIVEFPNQVAREIGTGGFLDLNDTSQALWPGFGNPFADYWPIGAPRTCTQEPDKNGASAQRICCYRLGGCGSMGSYPERRHTPIDRPQSPLDPALVFDIPAYGHLGYDAAKGAPDPDRPVQDQYAGTWSLYKPLDDDPRLADFLAGKIVEHMESVP